MLVTVERFKDNGRTTLSLVRIDGRAECFGLEDTHRDVKVDGQTRVGAGRYVVKLRTSGGMNGRYAKALGTKHFGMLWLQDVPLFNWIYLHWGNGHADTAGCILLGTDAVMRDGRYRILNSKVAYLAFYSKVVDAAKAGTLEILIVDVDA
ncbi:MAG: hypothetical protein KAR40_15385 [Candidatus Sabulitectum sp.]|nr:hypothetical protein [Candidatus Sabulitectum sp.]